MIASWAMVRENQATLRMASVDGDGPNAIQLAGCEPAAMAEAARIAEGRGADLIDINFGCPVKKVAVGQSAGSALMRDEVGAARLLEATVRAVPVPVTLKMRMGWDHANAERTPAGPHRPGVRDRHGDGAWPHPAAILHRVGRLGFHRLGEGRGGHPGDRQRDITTVEQAAEARARSGADGVMVGRGCYGRPWFPAQVAAFLRDGSRLPDPSLAAQKAILLEHYAAMLSHFGVQPGLRLGRKHVAWYSRGLHGSAEFRAAVMRQDDVASVRALIDAFYDPLIATPTVLAA